MLERQGKFAAKVECHFCPTRSKELQFDGVVLGEMIDFWRHFDSFADEEMCRRGEEKECTCAHAGHEKDSNGMCLEYYCHGDDCEFYRGTGPCYCDMMETGFAQCSCTWSERHAQGGCCAQQWDGYARGKLDDIKSVVGVWGLVDVVENYHRACLQEARDWGNVDEHFSEFGETESTFTNKMNTIIELLQNHNAASEI